MLKFGSVIQYISLSFKVHFPLARGATTGRFNKTSLGCHGSPLLFV